jgi:hypothetical protein
MKALIVAYKRLATARIRPIKGFPSGPLGRAEAIRYFEQEVAEAIITESVSPEELSSALGTRFPEAAADAARLRRDFDWQSYCW